MTAIVRRSPTKTLTVLEPFYRGEESRARQIPGSGLGLSLVSRIVRTYRGRLSIDSMAGRAATGASSTAVSTNGASMYS